MELIKLIITIVFIVVIIVKAFTIGITIVMIDATSSIFILTSVIHISNFKNIFSFVSYFILPIINSSNMLICTQVKYYLILLILCTSPT